MLDEILLTVARSTSSKVEYFLYLADLTIGKYKTIFFNVWAIVLSIWGKILRILPDHNVHRDSWTPVGENQAAVISRERARSWYSRPPYRAAPRRDLEIPRCDEIRRRGVGISLRPLAQPLHSPA